MEIQADERLACVSDAVYCTIIEVGEIHFPATWKAVWVNCAADILSRDISTVAAHSAYRLVCTSVRMLELLHLTTCSLGDEVVAKSETEHRLLALKHFLEILYSLFAVARTSRTV